MPISSVVLAGQRIPVNEAIYSVKTSDKESVGHPLIESGQKLLPSVTRVFSASRDMHFYLEGYEQYAETAQPLVAFATFYRDGGKVFDSEPVVATKQLDRTSKAVPIRFSVPIDRIPPGRYDCQVTVVDPAGQKAAFWQASIAIVP